MEIDQNKFMNLIIEKTNRKMNELQAQVIVLESQLQIAAEVNRELVTKLDSLNKKKEKNIF